SLRPYPLPSFRPHPPSTLFPYTTLFRSPIIEANQRHSLYYHSPAAPADWDQLLIGYYIEDTIYSQLYYGYGGVGQAGDRLVHSKDRKSTRLNSSHEWISYAVFCLKKKRH